MTPPQPVDGTRVAPSPEKSEGGGGRPVFVVGCPRSGTTLVRVLLDGHSRLSIAPESHFVVSLARRGARGRASVEDILGHPRWPSWKLDADAVRQAVRAEQPSGYAELLRTVYGCYAQARGKPRWGDKTPGYVSHIPLLLQLFPEAQIVHVIRDGRDVAASLAEQEWGPGDPVVAALQWRRKVAAGRRAGRQLDPGQYLEARLEDLIADLEGGVRRMCAFLGEEFEPAMLDHTARADAMFEPGHPVTRRVHEHVTPGLRDWRAGLSPGEQRAIEAVCHRRLSELGYPSAGWSLRGAAHARLTLVRRALHQAPGALRARLTRGRDLL